MDMGINGSLFFRLRMATKNMRDMPAILAVKYIRQMVTGGAFAEANKGAVDDHDFVLFKVVIYTLAQSGRGSYWSAHNEHKHSVDKLRTKDQKKSQHPAG